MSRISKGKLKYLWSVYAVHRTIAWRQLVKRWKGEFNAGIRQQYPIHSFTDDCFEVELVDGVWRRKLYSECGMEPEWPITPAAKNSIIFHRVTTEKESVDNVSNGIRELKSDGESVTIAGEGGRNSRRMGKPGDPNITTGMLLLRELYIKQCSTADQPLPPGYSEVPCAPPVS